MKKLVIMLTAIFTMAFSGMCMASDGGDLNKQQSGAEAFIQAFTLEAPTYRQFSKGFEKEFKEKYDEKMYAALQEKVKDRFGRLKEAKFHSFKRYDDVDYVTYIASFSKEKAVNITLTYNKDNKMIDFVLSPLNLN